MVDIIRLGAAQPLDPATLHRTTAQAVPTSAPKPVSAAEPAMATPSAVAMIASRGAPLDMALVNSVRAAIAEARYPVEPDKIAARMIESYLAADK
ncbi:flagellar biosynthesis anti-sigma factor FlgM [Sphingomonas paeninsulae]|nr:flagellar biosynthesis anti-sigma factor FlgM [Sphingomonas paeninsulae]